MREAGDFAVKDSGFGFDFVAGVSRKMVNPSGLMCCLHFNPRNTPLQHKERRALRRIRVPLPRASRMHRGLLLLVVAVATRTNERQRKRDFCVVDDGG